MYSREERMRAIELYIKYDRCAADTVRELGYPSTKTLRKWYRAYLREQESGIPWKGYSRRRPKYSSEQKAKAIEYYLEHGRNISRTIRALGYPSRMTLRAWRDELAPASRRSRSGGFNERRSMEHKSEAVIALCSRRGSAEDVAREYGVSRQALYQWKNALLGKETPMEKDLDGDRDLLAERDALLSEVERVKRELYKMKLEVDVLKVTAKLIKKDPGVDPKELPNKEKRIVVDALRSEYSLKDLLAFLELARSSYFYHRKMGSLPDKYADLRDWIIRCFAENSGRYGYRRIHALLARAMIRVSEKVVRRIMREARLVVFAKRTRKYSSYQGEVCPAAPNLLERDFQADAPNTKWLTDITEFRIPAGKVYLSPIVDCFDGLLPSWTIGTVPNAELVNTMLDGAISTLKPGEHPLIHSDRGAHYRWDGWIARVKETGLTQSMSKKACTADNAACEGVFGTIKNELFYGRSWMGFSLEQFMDTLDEYLHWYNETRIKMSLGAMSPAEYRRSLGMAG